MQTLFCGRKAGKGHMLAKIDLTGVVSEVDPAGSIQVAGLDLVLEGAMLPPKGAVVKITAELDEMPASAVERPLWRVSSIDVFTTVATAAPPAPVNEPGHTRATGATAAPTLPTVPQPAYPAASQANGRFATLTTQPTRTNSAPLASTKPPSAKPMPQATVGVSATSNAHNMSFGARFAAYSKPMSKTVGTTATQAKTAPTRPAFAVHDDSDDDIPF